MSALAAPVSLIALRRALDGGATSIDAVFDALEARIRAGELRIGAFAASDWPAARIMAAGLRDTALGGLPVGVKDLYDTRCLPTAYGSPIWAGHRPERDAEMVERLAAAGATVPAKTTTTEFAFMAPAATGNPWAPERSPGGSSAGSAAAVAAGFLPAALGTQTAGSTVRPASFCGVAGFKPSFGLMPTGGLKPFAPSLDTVGLLAATVADVAFLFAALQGRDAVPEPPDAGNLRVGIVRTPWDGEARPPAEAALSRAVTRLGAAGVRLTEVDLPAALVAAQAAHGVIQGRESLRALAFERTTHPGLLSAPLSAHFRAAEGIGDAAWDAAWQVAQDARRAAASLWEECDALLTFAAADVAPADRSSTGSPVFNRLWTLLGVPCLSVPGLMERGLPVGLQMVGPAGADGRLLAAGLTVARLLGSEAPVVRGGTG